MSDGQFHRIGKHGAKYWGKAGAGIIYTDGESILLLKRAKGTDHPDTWAIPGGRSREGEAPIDTAQRETKEESGTNRVGQQFGKFTERDGQHTFTVFLYAVNELFDPEISEEHTDAQWVPIKKLDSMDLHPKFKKCLPYYLRAIDRKFNKGKGMNFSEWLMEKELTTIEEDIEYQRSPLP